MTDKAAYIRQLIGELSDTGTVEFETRLVCKMSPHTPPTILNSISANNPMNYSEPVLNTIIQRLKLIKYENSKGK